MRFRDFFWTQGQPWRGLRSFFVPRLLRLVHCSLMCTLRITTTGFHQLNQYYLGDRETGTLFVLWHDHTLVPLHILRGKGVGVMMSTSRAGQMQAAFWSLYGWRTVWGSTRKREGIRALREVMSLLSKGQCFGLTPDGPKGPRHYAQPGVIFLASKTPAPIIPLAVAASRSWRLSTWDKYLIPKPFSHVHIHVGEPIFPPPELDREGTEHWRQVVEDALKDTDRQAQLELEARLKRPAA